MSLKKISLITKNHKSTDRNYLKRMINNKIECMKISKKYEFDYWDGDRKYGYGGFSYNKKFWSPVVPTFQKYWGLKLSNSVLDVGCAKGFMIYDFLQQIPGLKIQGIDISLDGNGI